MKKYSHSVFIWRLTEDSVSFQTPVRTRLMFLVNPKEYISRVPMERIGRNVPRADARWTGALPSRFLQINGGAFRAAGIRNRKRMTSRTYWSGESAHLERPNDTYEFIKLSVASGCNS